MYLNENVLINYFKYSYRHKIIYLDFNQIESMDSDTFCNILDLWTLGLGDNCLHKLPIEVFRNNIKLVDLFLNNNKLTEIPKGLFKTLAKLRDLDLSNNELEQVDFQGLSNLRILDLRGNNLKTLPAEAFKDLKSLEYLYISNNQIEAVSAEFFAALPNLKVLKADGNFLNKVPKIINLPNLEDADFSHNQLTMLPPVFSTKPCILNFSNNKITRIKPDSFEHNCTSVAELDLSQNLIADIESNILCKLPNLTTIRLEKNPTTEHMKDDEDWLAYFG